MGAVEFFFWGLGAFLKSPFRSEHFESTQVRGVHSPVNITKKWGQRWSTEAK